MKKILFSILVIAAILFQTTLFGQGNELPKSLGLPGDNLDLYSVLNLFQQSPTLEEFEKKLNEEDVKINNLDLDGDGQTDYIYVIDNVDGSAHAIVLRVAVNKTETQDVAVIEVEKDNNNQIHIQIVGDEALYGKDYIVEPNDGTAQGTPNPGYTGDNTGGNTTVNNNYSVSPMVATWPIISFMYTPAYVRYNSPYYYGYYPKYWNSWRPLRYNVYYGYHRPYYGFYHRTYSYRAPVAHTYYGPRRTVSVTVGNRNQSGAYQNTYKGRSSNSNNSSTDRSPRIRPNNSPNTTNNTSAQPAPRTRPNNNQGTTNNSSQKNPSNNNVPQTRSTSNPSQQSTTNNAATPTTRDAKQQRNAMNGNKNNRGGGRKR
jgi:hypothetical protein